MMAHRGVKAASLALAAASLITLASPALAGPEEDGNAGLDAIKAGNYTLAVQKFTHAIASGQMAPDDREFAYVQRGMAYLHLNNKTAAAADFEHALKIKPDDSDASEGLAQARAGGRATGGGGARGVGGGGNPLQLAQAGMEAMKGADYARAVDLFTRAIQSGRMSPDDLELAYASRGQAYLKQGDIHNALQDLGEALQRKADDSDAQASLVEALGKVPPPSPAPAIDPSACKKSITSQGGALGGKTFSGYLDYPGVDRITAFAGLYRGIAKYTPAITTPWQVSAVNVRTGIITASVTPPGSSAEITLDARVETFPQGTRVTMEEKVNGMALLIDVKGSLCKTLNGVVH